MRMKSFLTLTLAAILAFCFIVQFPGTETVHSQGRPTVTAEMLDRRRAIENELQSIATVERKLMIPMRDGKRIATDTGNERCQLMKELRGVVPVLDSVNNHHEVIPLATEYL